MDRAPHRQVHRAQPIDALLPEFERCLDSAALLSAPLVGRLRIPVTIVPLWDAALAADEVRRAGANRRRPGQADG